MGYFKKALIILLLILSIGSLQISAEPVSLSVKINYDRIENTDIIQETPSIEGGFGSFITNKGEFHFWKKFKPLNMLSNNELFFAGIRKSKIAPTREEAPGVYNISLVQSTATRVAQRSWEDLYIENANRADFLYAYAMYLKTLQDYSKALAVLERVTAVDPDYALGHFLKGDIYRYLGQYKNAVLSYVATININPYCTDAYFNIARIFEDFSQFELALDYYRSAYMTNPKDIEIRNSILRLQKQLALN